MKNINEFKENLISIEVTNKEIEKEMKKVFIPSMTEKCLKTLMFSAYGINLC